MLSFSPRDVLDEIWDLIESVPEGFPTYSFKSSGLSNFMTQHCNNQITHKAHSMLVDSIRFFYSRAALRFCKI